MWRHHWPTMRKSFPASRLFVWLAAACGIASAASAGQASFASPADAACALLEAIDAGDYPVFLSIAGDRMAAFWGADDTECPPTRMRFADAARDHGFTARLVSPVKAILSAPGAPGLFPAPLVKTDSGWQFDAEAGASVFKEQRVVANETAVIELCRRLREAEFEWSDRAHGGTAYAQKIRSARGQHDGLFWDGDEDEESPLGPVFVAAAYSEREPGSELHPLFGYYYRILIPAGGGFAFLAWPAEYGASGVRSFLITQSGQVYRRDLGRDSAGFAARLNGVPSQSGWTPVNTSKD